MSGIYSDPRYEALGLTDTTQARAADQFYGSIPQFAGMQSGYGQMQSGPGFEDEDDLEVAYEKDIIQRASQIDPTTPDYEFKLQQFFAMEDDPNAARYPRVQQALGGFLGRSRALQQRAQETMQEERKIRSQLAENGFSPDRLNELMREDGRLDLDRAYFQLGELKRTNGLSGKTPVGALNPTEQQKLIDITASIPQGPITDQEKIQAFSIINGREPETAEDWNQAFGLVEEQRYGQARNVIQGLESFGRIIPERFKTMAGLQASALPPPSPQAQSFVSPTQIAETQAATITAPAPVNPASPSISLSEAAQASRAEGESLRQEATQQQVNDQWNAAKGALEQQLLAQFQGDRNRLQQFYRSVISDETAAEGEEEVSYVPGEYDPTLQLPVAERTLRQAGVDPKANVPQIPNRGFFSGGNVSQGELLRALATERTSFTQPQATSLPRPTTQAERDALPSGARYISPDGQVRTKL